MRVAGIVSLRKHEIEERGLTLIPWTVWMPCYRCGEEVAMTPALQMQRKESNTEPWCYDCVYETNPNGVSFAISPAVLLEALMMKVTMNGGRVH